MDHDTMAQAERRLRNERRALRVSWLLLFMSAPVIVWALPTRISWTDGDPIVAEEINANFAALWSAVEAIEEKQGPKMVSGGFSDPLNNGPSQIDLPADQFTVVHEQSIDVPAKGTVLVLGTVAVGSTSSSPGVAWVDIVGDGTALGNGATYMSLDGGTPKSATVHGLFRVASGGSKSYSVRALTAVNPGASRGAHVTLVFIPD